METASALAVFGGPPKSGRYVYGFQRGQKKRPIRLRYLAGPKKTADTFTVFTTSPTPITKDVDPCAYESNGKLPQMAQSVNRNAHANFRVIATPNPGNDP